MYQPATTSVGGDFRDIAIRPLSAVSPITGWPARAKRLIDIILALIVLAFVAVPMLLAALWIRLDSPGPALFRQRRIGFGNASFELWKFRTMYAGVQETGCLTQAGRDDPRITRAGRFLRRSSFDELPQLFNVLRGEMSLVGPRPHAPGTCAGGTPFEQVTPHYRARHCVRPGITGLAQVRGWRGATETKDKLLHRLACDLEYIDTWSLLLDLRILARTIIVVPAMRSAY